MKLLKWHYLLSVSLVGFTLFQAETTRADIGAGPITCTTGSVGAFAFGIVDPLSSQTSTSATLEYNCIGSSSAAARVCFSFGPLESTNSYREIPGPSDPSPKMTFNLFSDPSLGNIINSANPLQVTFNTETSANIPLNITVYAQTLANQTTLFPGTYSLQDKQVFMTVNSVDGSTPPANCIAPVEANTSSTYKFPFTVQASVSAHCSISPTGVFNLGTVSASTTAISESSVDLISVTCTNGTPYNIGLAPSNGNVNGEGVMTGTGNNPDKVPYQLRSNASGEIWGNTATATSRGNGVAALATA